MKTDTTPATYSPANVLRMLERMDGGAPWDRISPYELEAALLCAVLEVTLVVRVLAETMCDCIGFAVQSKAHRALFVRATKWIAELAEEERTPAEYDLVRAAFSVLLTDADTDRLPEIGNTIVCLLEGLGALATGDDGHYPASDFVITVVRSLSEVEGEQRQIVEALRKRIAALAPQGPANVLPHDDARDAP